MIQLHTVSSMRAALNSKYCMRATLAARKSQMTTGDISDAKAFYYKEGQHAVNGNGKNGHGKVVLPPEVKVMPIPSGKSWSTPAMEVELRDDVLEIRDGYGNIVDSIIMSRRKSQPI